MATVDTKTQTRYVQSIAAADATSDQITISERDPLNPATPAMSMVGFPYTFNATRPHGYTIGQAFVYTQTVETAP